ncbi:MAG: A/G-specific adenine glycosylase [bacterium]|nr:A/G-specific adenine glycosylase [bacterium]
MEAEKFRKTILDWYKKNRRDMPWRETKDPYRILVSEVMLQQTQVARVLPKYGEFLKEFPTLEALARASDRKLLKVWSGLGYWRRAANLKRAAKKILKEHGGTFPKESAALETLPGVGPYTARAVACFAFSNQDAFLDTNIRRVYLHFFFPKRKQVSDKEILKVAQRTLWKNDPREWHYALFDYGSEVVKDKKINKKSKHYAKQSAFKGSFRSFRTKVMRYLLDQPGQRAPLGKIRRVLVKARSPHGAEKILSSLVKDGLVKKRRNSYSL